MEPARPMGRKDKRKKETKMSIQEHVNAVREKMAAAAKAAGRDPGEITLCAATKVQTDDTIREAIAAGITVCGENRVQELTAHLEPERYIGRCPEQVTEFLQQEIAPVLAKYPEALQGSDVELKV